MPKIHAGTNNVLKLTGDANDELTRFGHHSTPLIWSSDKNENRGNPRVSCPTSLIASLPRSMPNLSTRPASILTSTADARLFSTPYVIHTIMQMDTTPIDTIATKTTNCRTRLNFMAHLISAAISSTHLHYFGNVHSMSRLWVRLVALISFPGQ